MPSIASKKGDRGQTGLHRGRPRLDGQPARRDVRRDADELNASIGFARSICDDGELAAFAHAVQRDYLEVGSALATAPQSPKGEVPDHR